MRSPRPKRRGGAVFKGLTVGGWEWEGAAGCPIVCVLGCGEYEWLNLCHWLIDRFNPPQCACRCGGSSEDIYLCEDPFQF